METVFIVDGDPAVRDSLSTLLDLNGFPTRCFSTGGAFLREFNQLSEEVAIRCVVCEADLPDTDGIEIYRSVRALTAPALTTPAPFVLLVSRRNANIIKTAHEAGIGQVFLKPLVHRHLIQFISAGDPQSPADEP